MSAQPQPLPAPTPGTEREDLPPKCAGACGRRVEGCFNCGCCPRCCYCRKEDPFEYGD